MMEANVEAAPRWKDALNFQGTMMGDKMSLTAMEITVLVVGEDRGESMSQDSKNTKS